MTWADELMELDRMWERRSSRWARSLWAVYLTGIGASYLCWMVLWLIVQPDTFIGYYGISLGSFLWLPLTLALAAEILRRNNRAISRVSKKDPFSKERIKKADHN